MSRNLEVSIIVAIFFMLAILGSCYVLSKNTTLQKDEATTASHVIQQSQFHSTDASMSGK